MQLSGKIRMYQSVMALLLCCFGIVPVAAAGSIVIVVSQESTVEQIKKKTVKRLYLGRKKRLPNGERARVLDHPSEDPLREKFYTKVVGKTGGRLESYWSKLKFTGKGQPPEVLGSSADLIETIKDNPQAITYLDKSEVVPGLKVVLEIK